jgi:hypothetical protein
MLVGASEQLMPPYFMIEWLMDRAHADQRLIPQGEVPGFGMRAGVAGAIREMVIRGAGAGGGGPGLALAAFHCKPARPASWQSLWLPPGAAWSDHGGQPGCADWCWRALQRSKAPGE